MTRRPYSCSYSATSQACVADSRPASVELAHTHVLGQLTSGTGCRISPPELPARSGARSARTSAAARRSSPRHWPRAPPRRHHSQVNRVHGALPNSNENKEARRSCLAAWRDGRQCVPVCRSRVQALTCTVCASAVDSSGGGHHASRRINLC